MSIFNGKRLTNKTFKLDIERMRKGWYTDKYFINISETLSALSKEGYHYQGKSPRLMNADIDPGSLMSGNIEVEMQMFCRRAPFALVAGVDKALSILRHCTGYFDEGGEFVPTWQNLKVEAIHDGAFVHYDGDPRRIQPVLKIRGRYRDFSILETPTLGSLTRGSRIATNVFNTIVAARGKPILFFPARFDAHEVQAADGYAYSIAVQRYNKDYEEKISALVSTDAQGDWWGSDGGGTVAHAAIACFFGDLVETMLAFAATCPTIIPRIALVDFNNDSVGDAIAVAKAFFARYTEAAQKGDWPTAQRYILYGVRLDTGANVRDSNLPPLGDRRLDMGVNPRLVWAVRRGLNEAWKDWNLSPELQAKAAEYCRKVRIMVSGGFGPEKIRWFEELEVPVDSYGVGSSLMSNDGVVGTNNDFTADVVKVRIDGHWVDMGKVGRIACENPDLEPVDLTNL